MFSPCLSFLLFKGGWVGVGGGLLQPTSKCAHPRGGGRSSTNFKKCSSPEGIMHCSLDVSVCSPVVRRRNWRLAPSYIVMLQGILGTTPPPLCVYHRNYGCARYAIEIRIVFLLVYRFDSFASLKAGRSLLPKIVSDIFTHHRTLIITY